MSVRVDDEQCLGCGVCLDVCPTGALHLVDGVATIDQAICRGCKACVDACPAGALVYESETERLPIATNAGPAMPMAAPTAQVMPAKRVRKVWPWLMPALAFVGREIAPRVALALLAAWDQRSGRESLSYDQSQPASPQPVTATGKSIDRGHHQFRLRHGRR